MEKTILEFYKESLQIDYFIPDSQTLLTDYTRRLQAFDSADWNVKLLYYIYSRTLSDIQCYAGTRTEYFAPIDGNKVIVCKDYIGIIDLWFPSERDLFDLTSPILSGWLISEIIKLGKLETIDDAVKVSTTISSALNSLIKSLIGITVWGFWLGDQRRGTRERGIKIRELVVDEVKVPTYGRLSSYYDTFPLYVTMTDKKSRKKLYFDHGEKYNGWNFYLSKELLSKKLEELEILWMRGYDNRVRSYDYEIKKKTKELENLKNERLKYENGIEEFRKKIHDKLWKSF